MATMLCGVCAGQSATGWPVYNGGPDGDHYSRLTQINRANVQQLKVAWSFDTGEKGGIQDNPLVVGRTLYAYTPTQKVVALDAATGKLKWKFDSGVGGTQPARGMAYWTDGKQGRIFAGVMNFLYCLDAETGKPVASFGESGPDRSAQGPARRLRAAVDCADHAGGHLQGHDHRGRAQSGDASGAARRCARIRRAYREAALELPHHSPSRRAGLRDMAAGGLEDGRRGQQLGGHGAGCRAGIVYVPTGSAVFDFYGGDRLGDDLYANTLLALDANTGKRLWHFQGVHHDIWDRDFPSEPALFTLKRDGKTVEALAQTTKQGYLYLFDRVTGKPLFPIHELPYPASTVPGEVTSPTQPKPDAPEPFARQRLTEDMLTTRTPEAHAWALKEFQTFSSDGQFVPLAVGKQTVVFPGFDGGAEWGGPAIDPATNILYVNANEMAWTGGLVPAAHGGSPGAQVYQNQCAMCHGPDRAGAPPAFPTVWWMY